jgi:hypothetical protein
LEEKLTQNEKAEVEALIALINSKLYYANLYYFWLESENYSQVTRPLYGASYPFPLNYIAPYKMKLRVKKLLQGQGSGDEVLL